MHEYFESFAQWCAVIIEAIGVGVIVLVTLIAIAHGAVILLKHQSGRQATRGIRQQLGRGILLGLEFLVAGDIIYTVAVDLTIRNVGVLAIIVLIRTFLSFTLEVEITGKWPWQQSEGRVPL
jgi:uncharacterized membrane protein